MRQFFGTAEKVLRVKHGNPVVRTVIDPDTNEVYTDRKDVERKIAEYFAAIYHKDENHQPMLDSDVREWDPQTD